MKTIAQISTPLGSGGISIIRLSGDNALNIATKIFSKKEDIKPRYMYLGKIEYNGFVEQCLMVYFKAPFSFTGEDVVEFQVHGGEFLTREILRCCLENGAVLAENGEFTKRAFMNGKVSLDEAESMIEMINATSSAELKANSKVARGDLFKKIKDIQEKLSDAIVDLEVSIDYPEHDDEIIGTEKLRTCINEAKEELFRLLLTAKDGKIISSGINVAIVGKPNVGKSSLLNALIGEDVAIVTDIKGTTRDVLKETITHKGIKINFIDTAGIRESDDTVEKIGIQRAKENLQSADIVLCVYDASSPFDDDDKELTMLTKDKVCINIINKTDISENKTSINGIEISAESRKNIDKVKDEIIDKTIKNNIDFSALILTNERQIETIKECEQIIEKIEKVIDFESVDILDLMAKELWQTLGKITGESENEDIIDKIFAKFCLGK